MVKIKKELNVEDFNLSERMFDGANTEGWHKGIKIEDVKEFIKRIETEVIVGNPNSRQMLIKLKKLAGGGLI